MIGSDDAIADAAASIGVENKEKHASTRSKVQRCRRR